ncbi:iron-containing redox enzyme family protein [Pleionea litopenaei]|uniref:Iron-containing redox enzyme family protein n=1 Tax=Pleionea litopenaei TaxID=3070815 RepID=A0AA51RTF0_9GAMM|nr:iron-containing redox enzyme family protein [Pleionea sp. HL-JVS1]WMS87366.1 iron-containing redox enzyme family protein [Pleionea sp. HL-JVS1]
MIPNNLNRDNISRSTDSMQTQAGTSGASSGAIKTSKAQILRHLIQVWSNFEYQLNQLPVVKQAISGNLTLANLQRLLLDHLQQVKEGSGWITRAASSITSEYLDIRNQFIAHAQTEHKDYLMLQQNYLAAGGTEEALDRAEKNLGTEAFSAWMYHRASQANPFDLIGAMFIIEGLGQRFAEHFTKGLAKCSSIHPDHYTFYQYHAQHDEEHIEELESLLEHPVFNDAKLIQAITKTAKVTARLYLLQLQEIGNN